jgi:AraC-like DNA-binding protein
MLRYVRIKQQDCYPQVLTLNYEGNLYYPRVHHTTIGQDRAIGQAETFRQHKHDLYHIVIYTHGEGVCLINGARIDAVPGLVVLVSPGQGHDFVTLRGSTVYSEVTFSFETKTEQVLTVDFERLLQLYMGVPVQLSPNHLGTKEASHQLSSIILQLTDHASSDGRTTDYYVQQDLSKILDWIAWSCTSFDEPMKKADTRLVKVKRFLERNYAQSLTIDQLADMADLSKGYLFRAFRKAYGQPPLAYQKQLRMEAAKTFLRSTALRCHEVSLRCGYENVPLFHRMFKMATGLTPGQYRKQSQGDLP